CDYDLGIGFYMSSMGRSFKGQCANYHYSRCCRDCRVECSVEASICFSLGFCTEPLKQVKLPAQTTQMPNPTQYLAGFPQVDFRAQELSLARIPTGEVYLNMGKAEDVCEFQASLVCILSVEQIQQRQAEKPESSLGSQPAEDVCIQAVAWLRIAAFNQIFSKDREQLVEDGDRRNLQ
ncbi:hypothetical protein STEG23_015826, partial [Scotinomys teguina]